MRLEQSTPEILNAFASLFAPESRETPDTIETETRKSSWIAGVTYVRRGGLGHLLIENHDGGALLVVGEGVMGWMAGLVSAGIWSAKAGRLSRGFAYHRLIRSQGDKVVSQVIRAEDVEGLKRVMEQGKRKGTKGKAKQG